MRRALTEPCLLFEDFGNPVVAAAVAEVPRGAQWVVAYGTICVSRFVVGGDGRQERARFVASEQWRQLAPTAPLQPEVHWLAERGMGWPRPLADLGIALVYTTDVERLNSASEGLRRGVPAREQLPQGTLWPVVGHPGRLLALLPDEAARLSFEERLAVVWGPRAEPSRVHALG